MYIWLRLAHLAVTTRGKPPVDPLAEVRTPVRIGPGDLDAMGHLNNGRYLTLLDLGRFDMAFRTGLYAKLRPHSWAVVVAALTIRFRRPLKLLDKVVLTTRIIYWDEKWFYVEQTFEKDGSAHAKALVRCAVLGPQGTVPMAELLTALGDAARPVPPMPAAVKVWRELDALIR